MQVCEKNFVPFIWKFRLIKNTPLYYIRWQLIFAKTQFDIVTIKT